LDVLEEALGTSYVPVMSHRLGYDERAHGMLSMSKHCKLQISVVPEASRWQRKNLIASNWIKL
jgi:hypothetical protein